MRNDTPGTRSGSALAYGLIIMASVSIILTSILTFVTSQIKNSFYTNAKEQSFQIAESGIHFYKWYLAHNTDGRTTQQIQAFWDSGTALGVGTTYEADYTDPSTGTVVGRYRIEVTPPTQGSTVAIAKSTGWTTKYPANTRTIQVRFRRPSWSEWSVLANDFMRFGEGTEVYGKLHSNQGIRFDGVAHNLVTSSVATFNDPDHNGGNEFGVHTHDSPEDPLPPAAVPARTDVFEAGREFPTVSKDFNGVLGDLAYMKSEAQAGVNGSRYFDSSNQGRHIILRTDGTFDIRTVRSFNSSTNNINNYQGGWSTYAIPDNGVIFVEGHVWLEGAIDGERVTIAAANLQSSALKSVFIGNDITYTNYDGTDVIGVLAQNDVEIIRDSETDLRVDAALVAAQGRVGRANYGSSDNKDVITVFGAIVTNERYGFAWTNGTQSWGYTTRNLYYDNQLLYGPPPYFPTGTQYSIDLWEEL